MKRTNSRALIFVLVFLMVFSNFSFASAISADKVAVMKEMANKIDFDLKETVMDDDQLVRVIVELEAEPVILKATAMKIQVKEMDDSTVEKMTTSIVKTQDAVIQSLESEVDMEIHESFTNVFNGFATTVKYGDIDTIAANDSVKKVYLSNEYSRPQPQMTTSPEITNSQYVNEILNYSGEGMVVAVIDTGIDPSHKDFTYDSTTESKYGADIESEIGERIDDLGLLGQYYTDKVPYGYNYMDGNNEILDLGVEASMHGMHVAGTVAADGFYNPLSEDEYIKGVAPKAQVLALKVFGNDPEFQSTFGDTIIAAIDDAIALDADVMNLSLGSTAAWIDESDPEQMAIARAVENGIVMSISAGNSAKLGDGYSNPLTTNPDTGVVGSPGISGDSLQVASVDNTTRLYKHEVTSDDLGELVVGYGRDAWEEDTYELVAIGNDKYGYPADYDGIDVEGKIALVSRGKLSFYDKTEYAAAAGAAGILVYNNDPDKYFYIDQGGWAVPFMKTQYGTGEILEALVEDGPIEVEVSRLEKYISPFAGQVSSFSSWGTTPTLDFKPEIAAPGGSIYSTLNNDEYGFMSGTSMAAPHVAGGAALVLQRLDDDSIFEDELTQASTTPKDKAELAKNILMNTGRPTTDAGDGYASPRQQGAGSMDLLAATETEVVVTETTSGIAKVNLGEINDDEMIFNLQVKNYSDTASKKFTLDAIVQTNDVALNVDEDYFGEDEDFVTEVNASYSKVLDADVTFYVGYGNPSDEYEITDYLELDPNAEETVTVVIENIDTDFVEDNFVNGNFIEGYVFFRTHEEDLYNEKEAAKTALEDAKKDVTDAEDALEGFEAELAQLEKDLNGTFDDQGTLVTNGLVQDLEVAEDDKAAFEEASALLFAEKAELDALKAKLVAGVAAYDAALMTYSDLVASKQEMADARDGIKNFEDRVEELNTNLIPAKEQEITDAKALLTDDYAAALEELERLEDELEDLKDQLVAKQALLLEKEELLAAKQAELDVLIADLKILNDNVSVGGSISYWQDRLNDVDDNIDSTQRTLISAISWRDKEPTWNILDPINSAQECFDWCDDVESFLYRKGYGDPTILEKYVPGVTRSYLDDAITEMETDLALYQSQFIEYTGYYNAYQIIFAKESEVDAKQAEVDVVNQAILDLQAEIATLEQSILDKEAEIEAQKQLMKSIEAANEATLILIAQLEAELAELEEERDEKQEWLDKDVFLIQEVRKYFQGLATAKTLMDDAKSAMDDATQAYNDAYALLTDDEKAALAAYEADLALMQNAIDDINAAIEAKDEEIADKKEEIANKEDEIPGLEDDVLDAQEAYDNADDAYYNALPLSVPFISFYGNWDDAPAFDAPWYNNLLAYVDPSDFGDLPVSFYGVTGLLNTDYDFMGLGYDTAFSPNGDGAADVTFPVFSLMRNLTDVNFNIYADSDSNEMFNGDDALLRTINTIDGMRKHYFDGGQGDMYYLNSVDTTWDGTANLETVVDGQYFYVIEGDLAEGSHDQLVLPVMVDTVNPEVLDVIYEQGDDELIVDAWDELSGVGEYLMVEIVDLDEDDNPIYSLLDTSYDGIFDMTELEDRPYIILIVVYDNAQNGVQTIPVIVNDDNIPEVRLDVEPFGVYGSRTIDASGYVMEMTLPTVWLDGEEVALTYNASEDTFDFAKTFVYESDGKKAINVEATDSVSNDIEFMRHFYVDATPPTIDVTSDVELLDGGVVTVAHTMDTLDFSAAIGDNFPDLKVTYNGSVVFTESVDFVSYEDQLLPVATTFDKTVTLKDGYNFIQLAATDAAGTVTTVFYQVYRLADGEVIEPEPATVVSLNFGTVTKVEVKKNKQAAVKVYAVMSDDSEVEVTNNEGLTLSTSNTSVASITGTSVKGISAGSATLTATLEGKTATLPVTVTNGSSSSTGSTGSTTSRTTTTSTTAAVVEIIEEEVALGAGLLQGSYIDGYTDGTFRPDNLIKRSEIAKVFNKILLLNEKTLFVRFTDVSNDHWAYGYINSLKEAGLINGYGDYTYRPEENMTRAELAQILSDTITFVGGSAEIVETPYTDIEGHWAAEEIAMIYSKGIKTDETSQFRPDEKVTRAEAVVMINLFLGRTADENSEKSFSDVPTDHWASGHIWAASK